MKLALFHKKTAAGSRRCAANRSSLLRNVSNLLIQRLVLNARWRRNRLDQVEARPVKLDWLRQSDRLEESGLAGDGHVRPKCALLGPETKHFGYRLQRFDQPDQLIWNEIGLETHDFRPRPVVEPLESEIDGRAADLAGCDLQCRYVTHEKSADKDERGVPVIARGPLAGKAGPVRFDCGVDFSPLLLRRPEGKEYPFLIHECVREFPARREPPFVPGFDRDPL